MIMTKVPEFARPHEFAGSVGFGVDATGTARKTTIIPIVTYDEGLGVINSYKSNPQNASFVEYAGAKCYPTSRINKINCKLQFQLTKEAIQTDKIAGLKFAVSTIHCSFEDGEAEDEVSTLDLNEILELQRETSDRQTFALYNGIKMRDGKANVQLDLEVGQEGLTTDLELEGTAFTTDDYYDCLKYYTNGKKLRSIATSLRWYILTPQNAHKIVYINQHQNTKFMNPYTFLGVMIHVPSNNQFDSLGKVGDTTDTVHMQMDYRYSYQEFNHEFNHSLQ